MSIDLIITPKTKDLGGFQVRRALPHLQMKKVGPWVFFDHMGPAQFSPGQGIDVRPHPHINLATVTYLFAGEIYHQDSLGFKQAIKPGDVNLMVAGRGIVHSERQQEHVKKKAHELHGLQLWLALPEGDEEIEPDFIHYPQESIPQVSVEGVVIRVMIGEAYGVVSPVKQFAKTCYFEAHMQKGQQLTLPRIEESAIYVISGGVECEGVDLNNYQMAVLSSGAHTLAAKKETRVALVGGEKLSKRYLDWNFVSSRKARIEEAKESWRQQKFAKIPGDAHEFIPLPE